MNRLTPTRPLQVTLSALVLLLASSCVSQRQHDDMIATAKFNQKSLLEKEQYVAKLEAENERLRAGIAQNSVAALSEANFGDDLESRLSALQGRIDGLGRPLEDIERFDVEGGYVLMVQDKILFASGSAELSAEGRQAIEKLSAEINARPHGRIWVRGHTDSDPVSKPQTKAMFPRGNLQLSAARAIEVASELSAGGKVAARDVAVVGFGQHDPIRPNKSADDKRLNRRVEIFVSDLAPQGASAGQ